MATNIKKVSGNINGLTITQTIYTVPAGKVAKVLLLHATGSRDYNNNTPTLTIGIGNSAKTISPTYHTTQNSIMTLGFGADALTYNSSTVASYEVNKLPVIAPEGSILVQLGPSIRLITPSYLSAGETIELKVYSSDGSSPSSIGATFLIIEDNA